MEQLATDPSTSAAQARCWEHAPREPRLAEGALHVWRADLSAVADELRELLSPEERARAERFLNARDRRLWTRAHGVLRALLGRYLESDPRALRIATGAHGKPTLLDVGREADPGAGEMRTVAGQATSSRLAFNISHSSRLALYALTETGPVGIDVEVARRPIDELAIAERTFGSAEAERLRALDPVARGEEFLRLWVRHEATLKYRGVGIGRAGVPSAAKGATGGEPWIAELDVGPRAAAAVVAPRPPRELRCWLWDG
jgi:4'-phosphopantetheinyl transferase